ncbi:Uncharacterised protein [Serratia fonticola]|uniref:DUF6404 family protein n=1 Tax=Serratia fonticola TaxID=47917 RepID=UPI00217C0D6C|nr:DUF6404 family protein [Serratia fonticola]CAI1706738.1 Uncharacterised protein [Serratia fonticola]
MTFDEKKERALALMAEKKMWRSNYAPPLLRLLWKFGVQIPPPPFMSFWLNVLCFGVFFGSVWGLFMWFTIWNSEGYSAIMALQTSLFAGGLFGLMMALYHYWRKRVNKLPNWDSL